MTRGAGWFSPPKALARKRSAAAASRLAERRKSIVAPVESTARYKYTHLPFTRTYVSSTRQESFVVLSRLRRRRSNSGAYRWTQRQTVTWSTRSPRSARSSTTSRYEREKRKYHPTASRMTSGSNCRHLNKPQTEEARRSIRPVYHGLPVKLQHCRRTLASLEFNQ